MVKRIILSVVISLFLITNFFVLPRNAEAATRVKGYTKKNGTYVQPHFKSNKNSTKFDNYSTKGNLNPYTGKKGAVNPYKVSSKKYK